MLVVVPAVVALLAGHALAQVPPGIAAQNRALGQKLDIGAAIRAYGPSAERPLYREVKVMRDLSYGPDPSYKLDVFEPKGAISHPLPVLVYATGGQFMRPLKL